MKKKILFMITSATNMGDLALTQEWVKELGQMEYQFGYVLAENLKKFVPQRDVCFLLNPNINVKETVLKAVHQFSADALIFACNAFWNLPEYKGVTFGEFLLQEGEIDIPVFSFDPFEIGFTHVMPQNGMKIPFSAVPSWVHALRYMSRTAKSSNAWHFKTSKTYSNRPLKNVNIIEKHGGDPNKKSLIFPISKDRYHFIKANYPKYYAHLITLFKKLPPNSQIFTVLPEPLDAFEKQQNIIQLPHVPFDDFQDLVQSCQIYLTDSYVSCLVTAIQLETPALLLTNSNDEITTECFLGNKPFKYKVFPYGMYEICQELETLFEVKDCFEQCEVLDHESFANIALKLLEDSPEKSALKVSCQEWKTARKSLLSPRQILNKILK